MLSWVSGTTRAKVRSPAGVRGPGRTPSGSRPGRSPRPGPAGGGNRPGTPARPEVLAHRAPGRQPTTHRHALPLAATFPLHQLADPGRPTWDHRGWTSSCAWTTARRRRAATGGGDESRSGPAARRADLRQRDGLCAAFIDGSGPAAEATDGGPGDLASTGGGRARRAQPHRAPSRHRLGLLLGGRAAFRGHGLATWGLDRARRPRLPRSRPVSASSWDIEPTIPRPAGSPLVRRVHGRRDRALQAPLRRPPVRCGDPRTAGDGSRRRVPRWSSKCVAMSGTFAAVWEIGVDW